MMKEKGLRRKGGDGEEEEEEEEEEKSQIEKELEKEKEEEEEEEEEGEEDIELNEYYLLKLLKKKISQFTPQIKSFYANYALFEMEIHHRLYEKSINYNNTITTTTTVATTTTAITNNLIPVICDTNNISGIPENCNFAPSTSSLINNTSDGTFVSLNNRGTVNINEFSGYSNPSTGLLNHHQTATDLSLNLTATVTSQAISLIAETSNETKNDLNINHHQQQQQHSRQLLPSLQNAENNICSIVGTLTKLATTTTTTATTTTTTTTTITPSIQSEQSNIPIIITTNRNSNTSISIGIRNNDTDTNNSNCNCAITTNNESNFSQRISKVPFIFSSLSSLSSFVVIINK
ncbi:unnamed protein product [Onchocerca ochengi]|uniref:BESS domain-containing protein n=1 Tax=Onchocerca ochengi TaxID=42157 RepID=A0A182ENQ7_ONCOC|nr:unnamed protein product [Onchocerca ochengi]